MDEYAQTAADMVVTSPPLSAPAASGMAGLLAAQRTGTSLRNNFVLTRMPSAELQPISTGWIGVYPPRPAI
jgi:hypothetical protein